LERQGQGIARRALRARLSDLGERDFSFRSTVLRTRVWALDLLGR
jgi:hypothetical protein